MTGRSRHDELRDQAAPIRRLWPSEHHRLCNTRQGKACDCYMRSYAEADAALTALLDEVAAAEARAADAERERDGLLRQRWTWQNAAEVAERGHKACLARDFEQRDEI